MQNNNDSKNYGDLKPPPPGGLEGSKILVFDNYDSFTYNLVHLVEKITHNKVDVYRNDQITLEEVKVYDRIILSPGPGIPEEAGLLIPLIKEYASSKSILGVCLGHQAIGEAFGAKLENLTTVYHGISTPIKIGNSKLVTSNDDNSQFTIHNSRTGLFNNLDETIEVGRYHSWVISNENFPEELEITAIDERGMIMALQHKKYDVQGVQFHPESILTPKGEIILRNWLGI